MMRLLLILTTLIVLTENAKILIYNPEYEFSKSHRNFHGSLADLLAEAGHNTMYQPLTDNDTSITGSNNPKVNIIHRKINVKSALNYAEFQKNVWNFDTSKFGTGMLAKIMQIFDEVCESQLRDTQFLSTLKSEKFDLGFAEYWESCGFGIFEQIGLEKRITIFTAMIHDQLPGLAGIPILPSFVPCLFFLLQLFYNHSNFSNDDRFSMRAYDLVDVMKRVTGKEFHASQKAMESSFIFINTEEHLEIPRPISHKFIYIGGFNWENRKSLDARYVKLINQWKNGAILVSFGSIANCSQMPKQMRNTLLKAFAEFPDNLFIWKHDEFDQIFDSQVSNVYYENWFPQKELLVHPKVMGIITHGGLNSVIEIAHSGTPAIGIPIFADQYKNVALFKYRKTGVVIDKNELTHESLKNALNEILYNKEHHKEAKLLAEIMASKPMSAKERILKYTDFAIKFGNVPNLDLYGKNLGLIEFYNIDIWLILLTTTFLVIILFIFVAYFLLKFFSKSIKIKRD